MPRDCRVGTDRVLAHYAVERCVGRSRLGLGRADATSDVGRLLDPEEARGVPAENLFALRVVEVSHRPLDRRRGVGPSAFVVRVVVGPHEVVHEVVLDGERQPERSSPNDENPCRR